MPRVGDTPGDGLEVLFEESFLGHAVRLSYASQRPSALERSTSRRPAGLILSSSISLINLPRLPFDHLLFGQRGVNRSSQNRSSKPADRASIHP